MADLSSVYMGLNLKNPLIVSSSSLTNTVSKIRRCEDAGAGAIVLKSLFEEQIESEARSLERDSWPFTHPEAFDYVRQMGLRMGQDQYLKLIEDAKKAVDLPIIASLNCVTPGWWIDYAELMAKAGADALELNIALLATNFNRTSSEIENNYVQIVEGICQALILPVAAKIGPYFTSLPETAQNLKRAGLAALVLFNRFYQLDIDIEKLELVAGYQYSSPEEINIPLRWIAILANRIGCDLAASTGIHDGKAMIKQLLAGANAVQICSNLYIKGLDRISSMLAELDTWMDRNKYERIEDFRGKLSLDSSNQPEYYERLQYIKLFVGIE